MCWWHALVPCVGGVLWWSGLVVCLGGGVGGMWVACVDGMRVPAHKTKMHCQFWWFLEFEVQNFVV